MGQRYQVIDGSESGHCCFDFTVIDTYRPLIIGGGILAGRFEVMCECFEDKEAHIICGALNKVNDGV